MIGSGAKNWRVQVLRAEEQDDGLQSRPGEFLPVGPWFAAVKRDVSDAERFAAGSVRAIITTRFQARWTAFTASISPADRLQCEGRIYEIAGVKEIGRRHLVEITAKAAL